MSFDVVQEDLDGRLARRKCCTPALFTAVQAASECTFEAANWQPAGSLAELEPGTYYLKDVKGYRRVYERVAEQS